jgi:chromosome segregation protein
MQFRKLKLLGFKSFVEASDFVIEPGLTGVVGPNGCGKSNLVEAMRWVMGESSYKAMRASGMDDVIFSGTNNRPARNNAEVALVLDNTDRSAPAAFNDEDTIEISRRIEREQGSTYRINGREVRQRDVHILFADASSGARSPALVRQGQIGEIISAKPEQRRRILEEAAGIAGLHARKHEAEVRLKGAEHNLERLEDVIVQVGSQIDSLKRQARQTTRYKNVANDIRKQQSILMAMRWRDAEASVTEAERAVHLAQRLVAEKAKIETEAVKLQTLLHEKINPLREAEAIAAAGLQRLNIARSDLDREEARAKSRAEELDRRVSQLTQDLERERSLGADAAEVLARLDREEKALSEEGQSNEDEQALRERLAAAEQAHATSERSFGEATVALAAYAARRELLDRAISEQTARLQKLESELAALDGGAEGALSEDTLAAVDDRAMRAEAARSAAVQALELARKPLTSAEHHLHRLETEAKALAKAHDVAEKKLWPPVVETIRVEPGYEAALGAALGDDLDSPLDSASPMHWSGAGPVPGDPVLPENTLPLSSFVEAPAALARRLAQIGVVEQAEGARLAQRLWTGQRLVSKEGDLWRWDGFIAKPGAPTAATKRLAARNRIAELDAEIETARQEVARRTEALKQAEADVLSADTAEQEARTAFHAAARASAAAEARTRLTAGREEATEAKSAAEEAIRSLPDGKKLEEELAAIRKVLAEHRTALGATKAELEGMERERAGRAQRLTFIGSERAGWNSRQEGAAGRVQALEERLTETRTERASLDDAPQAFVEQRTALLSQISEAEAARGAAADRLAEAESSLTDADKAGRLALDELATAREEAARDGALLEGARERRTSMSREVSDLLEGIPDAARLKEIIEQDGDGEPDIAAVESKLARYEAERERLGAVNLRANEELAEVEKQHEGLIAERDDLAEAIKRLRQGITSLDKEARTRLSASFNTVNEHFKKLFKSLFSGGTAELILTDSDDPLEAGLDILARPPGKKPQTLSLLSGGEQALTAMALIFAVFLTNPAPICVLDEVDAPLDDSNVERFCELLDEMIKTTKTRFMVITHNPITMARMNRLFGVTMAEQGVSQLVSVDLETAKQYQAA